MNQKPPFEHDSLPNWQRPNVDPTLKRRILSASLHIEQEPAHASSPQQENKWAARMREWIPVPHPAYALAIYVMLAIGGYATGELSATDTTSEAGTTAGDVLALDDETTDLIWGL